MKNVALDNDWRYDYRVTQASTTTGATAAASGLTVQAWFSATRGGATIDAALTKSLTEYASTAGRYAGIVDGDVLRTHLLAYVGLVVWEVFGDGTNVYTSIPRRVKAVRELQ